MPDVVLNPEFTPWVFSGSKAGFQNFINLIPANESTFRIIIFWAEADDTIHVALKRTLDPLPKGRFHWDFTIEKQKAIDGLANCISIMNLVFKQLDAGYMLIMVGEGDAAVLIKGSKVSVSGGDVLIDKNSFKVSVLGSGTPKGTKVTIV